MQEVYRKRTEVSTTPYNEQAICYYTGYGMSAFQPQHFIGPFRNHSFGFELGYKPSEALSMYTQSSL